MHINVLTFKTTARVSVISGCRARDRLTFKDTEQVTVSD